MNKGVKITGLVLSALAGGIAGAYFISEKKRDIKAFVLKKKRQVENGLHRGNPFEQMPNIFI